MSILREKIVKIRKSHKCWGCGDKFEEGTKLRYQVDVYSGAINSSYWCKVCDITVKECYDEQLNCGIALGDVKDYVSWDKNLKDFKRTY